LHRLRRILPALTAATVVASVVGASAASLGGLTSARLGAGDATVAACDSDGMTISYTVSGANLVTGATVGGIADPACEGGVLTVVLTGSTGSLVATSAATTIPTDAGTTDSSLTVGVSPQPSASTVHGASIQVVGP
jgi:hypothetical protein